MANYLCLQKKSSEVGIEPMPPVFYTLYISVYIGTSYHESGIGYTF